MKLSINIPKNCPLTSKPTSVEYCKDCRWAEEMWWQGKFREIKNCKAAQLLYKYQDLVELLRIK